MNPALKAGVACFAQSDGTQIRRGGSSFFIRDARLTPHIAHILKQIDGTRPVASIATDLPPQFGKLLDACLGQLASSRMLTSGTLADVRTAYPGLAIAARFRDLTTDWHACAREWTQARVGVGGAEMTVGVIDQLAEAGVGQVASYSALELCDVDLDFRIWLANDCDQLTGEILTCCRQYPGRFVLALAIGGRCAIFRNSVPSSADLKRLQVRLQSERAAPSVSAQLVREAHISYELALLCAERHGARAALEPELRVIEANGAVQSHALMPYLLGGAASRSTGVDQGLIQAAAPPAFCRDWFLPSGPLAIDAIASSMRFPLAHAAIAVSRLADGADGSAVTRVVDWGLDPGQAERKAIAAAIIALETYPRTASGRRFCAYAVNVDGDAARRSAAAEVLAQWLLTEHPTLSSGTQMLDRSQLDPPTQILLRLVTHLRGGGPALRSFTLSGTASVIVWADSKDMCTVGIGTDLNDAAQQALGDMTSALQLDVLAWRQQTQLYRQLQKVAVAGDVAEDAGGRIATTPALFWETLWQARAPHSADNRLASYVACWM